MRKRRRGRWPADLGLVVPVVLAGPLLAQTPPVVRSSPPVGVVTADGVTTTEVARHLEVLLADSMRGRGTPSAELERTAQYLVRQFQQLGLQPVPGRDGQDSTWLQYYPIPGQRRLNAERSRVLFYVEALRSGGNVVRTETGGQREVQIEADFARAAYFVPDLGPLAAVAPLLVGSSFSAVAMGGEQVALVTGRQTPASLAETDLRAKVVIYVPPAELDAASRRPALEQLYRTTQGVVLVDDTDATHFAAALHAAQQQPVPVFESFMRDPLGADRWPWAVAVRPSVLHGLAAAGVDMALARADTAPRVRDLPYLRVMLVPDADTMPHSAVQTAPNVMAWLEGSDSALRREVVVIAARMDANGAPPEPGDRQATDNAAGVAALLALAEAFSQPEARSRRSILFLAVSGGTKDPWGSRFFIEQRRPQNMVATLVLDLSGRPTDDSVTAVTAEGAEDIERLTLPPAWAAAAQPELGVRVIAGSSTTHQRADHIPFMQWGVPSIYLRTSASDTLASDGGLGGRGDGRAEPGGLAAHAARLARLVFAVGRAIANADQRPQWKKGVQLRRLFPEP